MKLAIIPARGGSKRIPHKNIKFFGDRPIIAWSIDAARQSGCFDRIIVSTDDPVISEIAKQYGAEVPFVRPHELSDDQTGTIPVIAHAINWQNNNGRQVSEACCIYATAPFLLPEDLQKGLRMLNDSRVDFTFSVTSYGFPIQRAIRITHEQRVEMRNPEHFNSRSQDLEEFWHDAGQFYWGKASAWLMQQPLFGSRSAVVPLPRHRVQDIDTPEDWLEAEFKFQILSGYRS